MLYKSNIVKIKHLWACAVSIRKLIPLDIFLSTAVDLIFQNLVEKLVHFITPIHIKE
jgi:hypothetical protein